MWFGLGFGNRGWALMEELSVDGNGEKLINFDQHVLVFFY